MNNEDMKKVAVKASVFAAVSIALMLQRSATKHIMITDAAGTHIDRGSAEDSYNLLVSRDVAKGKEGTLTIPLSKSVSSDDISLEDQYVNHKIKIYIDSREEGFYLDNPVVTDLEIFKRAVCTPENESGNVCLEFETDDLYASEISLTESSTIEISFFEPGEKYDRIVVIDPSGGGIDAGDMLGEVTEKEITLDVALELKELAERDTENDIRFFFSRLGDISVTDEKRVALAKDSDADMYIELTADALSDQSIRGLTAYYNEDFFLRRMDNASFADVLERNTAIKSGAEALGVEKAAEEKGVLDALKIPAARINLGNMANEEDVSKLQSTSYDKKLAEGIYQAVLEAFEEME